MVDKIDLVYMWVDGNDSEWRKTKNHWLQEVKGKVIVNADSAVDARWRDNDELKYALRSAEKYVPWINHIYLITGFGQVPSWLDTSNPKITVIPQETIMPKESQPTFNSVSIEMCLMNIPGLSEHFLLSNDDMLFNRPLKPDFFFDKRGRAIVWYLKHRHIKNVGFDLERISTDYRKTILVALHKIRTIFGLKKKYLCYIPSHNVDPYIKSSMIACRNHPLLIRDFDAQIRNKFRTSWEMQRWVFSMYDFVHKRAVLRRTRRFKQRKHFLYNLIFYRSCKNSSMYCVDAVAEGIERINPPLFCINDTVLSTDAMRKSNADFLAKKFPEKSSFEK